MGGSLGLLLVCGQVRMVFGALRRLPRASISLRAGFDLVIEIMAVATADGEIGVVLKDGDQFACEMIFNF